MTTMHVREVDRDTLGRLATLSHLRIETSEDGRREQVTIREAHEVAEFWAAIEGAA